MRSPRLLSHEGRSRIGPERGVDEETHHDRSYSMESLRPASQSQLPEPTKVMASGAFPDSLVLRDQD